MKTSATLYLQFKIRKRKGTLFWNKTNILMTILTKKFSDPKIKMKVLHLLKTNICKNVSKKIEMQVRRHFSHIKINRLQELKIFNFKRIPRTLKVLIVGVMRRANVLARFRKLLRIKYLIRCRSWVINKLRGKFSRLVLLNRGGESKF